MNQQTSEVVLRDTLARVVRLHEALVDGDLDFAFEVVADLSDDLEKVLEESR